MSIRMSGIASGLDTESIIKELMNAQKTKQTKISNKKTKLEWKQDQWKELNTKMYSFYTDYASKLRLESSYLSKATTSSNDKKLTATATSAAPTGSNTIEINKLASSQYVTGGKVSVASFTTDTSLNSLFTDTTNGTSTKIKITVGQGDAAKIKELTFDAGTVDGDNTTYTDKKTVSDFLSELKDLGLNASYDSTQKRFFISSTSSGEANQFKIETTAGDEGVLSKLGLGEIDGTTKTAASNTDMTVVAASDSEIVLNGATLTGSNNSFTVNGLTLDLKDTTAVGEKLTLNVNNDVDSVFKMVKEAVTKYNELLKEMNTKYYANTAKGYDVLTDEQKEAMTDDEVEKWESKIKDSLLRRDDTLNSMLSVMKSAVTTSVSVNGKKYSLASFGIQTSTDYTEKGLLHIYGNTEDSTYGSLENKLKKALTDNPEDTAKALSQIFTGMYTEMTDKMKSSTLSSALTFYNDKQMKKELTDYEDQIDVWDDRLQDMEDRYYKQYSKLETAMSKLNSQSSYLSGMFGTGQ